MSSRRIGPNAIRSPTILTIGADSARFSGMIRAPWLPRTARGTLAPLLALVEQRQQVALGILKEFAGLVHIGRQAGEELVKSRLALPIGQRAAEKSARLVCREAHVKEER